MDMNKIGTFIADTRKDLGLTQRELAEKLHISDKTVSKWERGNSLPDISVMLGLCEELHININELLSGERLSKESYDRKAEENMINLMEENKKQKENDKWSRIGTATGLLAVFIIIGYDILASTGFGFHNYNFHLGNLIDMQSLLLNIIILALILGPAGLLPDFFRSFKLAFQGRIDISEEQLNRALASQKYAIRALLLTGPISVLVQFIIMRL